jgi:hypothetical protein
VTCQPALGPGREPVSFKQSRVAFRRPHIRCER